MPAVPGSSPGGCTQGKHKSKDTMLKKRIHINQHKIRANKKHGTTEPVVTVKTYKSNTYGHVVNIMGTSQVIYSPDKPLSCGARVWIETVAPVEIIDTETQESKVV